jgi:hypothetical protein
VWQHVETGRETSAEAVVAAGWACREGLNSLMQGAVGDDSMGAERQQGGFYQPSLFEGWEESPRPDQDGEARSLSVRPEEPQTPTALDPARALTVSLYLQLQH